MEIKVFDNPCPYKYQCKDCVYCFEVSEGSFECEFDLFFPKVFYEDLDQNNLG